MWGFIKLIIALFQVAFRILKAVAVDDCHIIRITFKLFTRIIVALLVKTWNTIILIAERQVHLQITAALHPIASIFSFIMKALRGTVRKADETCLMSPGSSAKFIATDNNKGYSFKPFIFKELRPNSNTPQPRSGHRIVCDDANFYSFGGYLEIPGTSSASEDNEPGGTPCLFKELWRFNFASTTWEHLPTEGETPKELASHSAVMHGHYMVVFGGTGVPFGTSSSNKMSVCDLRTRTWQQVITTGTPPSPQYGQAIILDKYDFYVLGGTTGYEYSMDVHKLNLKTFEWETLFSSKGEAKEPTPRYRHEVAFDGRHIYVLGGGTATRAYPLSPIPTFDVETKEWCNVDTIGDPNSYEKFPGARKCQGAVQRGDDVYLCGGYNSKKIFIDLWKLNLKSLTWTRLPVTMPIPVYFHSTALTPAGCMLMFGGVTNVSSTTRTNQVFKIWLTIPSLKEMCWEAVLHYRPQLKFQPKKDLLLEGIPKDLLDRLCHVEGNRPLAPAL